MFRIGDFSKICQVSVKALRHWESEGLLRPASVDAETGYRYYSVEQVAEVNRILALRTMGLALPQIRRMLNDQPSADDLRAMLKLKQAELEQEIEQSAQRLRAVESRLKQLETGGILPGYEVALKEIAPQNILAVRDTVPTMQALVELLEETHSYSQARTGVNLLAVFYDDDYEDVQINVEIGFPVEGSQPPIPLRQNRQMRQTGLPGIPLMATTIHSGPWLSLSQGYSQLGRWIDENGYRIIGPGREVYYHIDWDDLQETTVTELQFPITTN